MAVYAAEGGGEGESSMRILAIDYGDARTGLAVSDATGTIAGETRVIRSRRMEQTAEAVAAAAAELGAEELVVGLPRNMDGTEGPRAALCRDFAAHPADLTGLEPVLWDERRTTVDAHRILSDNGRHGKRRKETVDAVAATLILEGYLAYRRGR